MSLEQFKIHVVNDNRFNIRIGLRPDAIASERHVAGRKDRGLGVVNVGVLDEGQIACATGDRNINVVLDTASRRTGSHSQISAASIRIEGHEYDVRALSCRDASEFGKLAVVTNLN